MEKLKNDLLKYLEKQKPSCVTELWAETKTWAKNKGYEMGGGYASCANNITVKLLVKKSTISFNVSLNEI